MKDIINYVMLEGLKQGNKFITGFDTEKDSIESIVKLSSGETVYKIIGFATTIRVAQKFLYGVLFDYLIESIDRDIEVIGEYENIPVFNFVENWN